MLPDAVDGGITVGFEVFGEHFSSMKRAGWVAPDDIREGTATIDPEVPTTSRNARQNRLRQSFPTSLRNYR
jgi:hypothetical protein